MGPLPTGALAVLALPAAAQECGEGIRAFGHRLDTTCIAAEPQRIASLRGDHTTTPLLDIGAPIALTVMNRVDDGTPHIRGAVDVLGQDFIDASSAAYFSDRDPVDVKAPAAAEPDLIIGRVRNADIHEQLGPDDPDADRAIGSNRPVLAPTRRCPIGQPFLVRARRPRRLYLRVPEPVHRVPDGTDSRPRVRLMTPTGAIPYALTAAPVALALWWDAPDPAALAFFVTMAARYMIRLVVAGGSGDPVAESRSAERKRVLTTLVFIGMIVVPLATPLLDAARYPALRASSCSARSWRSLASGSSGAPKPIPAGILICSPDIGH